MYVFYDDDGGFKAGNILSETDASLQVESETGKRSKIKRASTLFTFAAPEPAALESAPRTTSRRDRVLKSTAFSPPWAARGTAARC